MGRGSAHWKTKVSMLKIIIFFSVFLGNFAHAQQGPFVPLPYDYYETAGRVRVQQPINHLTLPGGRRLFEDSGLATDGGPGVKASGSGQIKNPSGNSVPVGASGRIGGSQAAGAIGRAIPKLVKQVAGPLGVGMVLYDLAKELDFDLSKDESGNAVYGKIDTSVCTVSPCYGYTSNKQSLQGIVYSTAYDMCYASAVSQFPGQTITDLSYSGTTTITCSFTASSYGYYGGLTGNRVDVPPSPEQVLPSTHQAFLDAIAAKSGWPSTSAISRALSDSVAATGEQLSITGAPTVTGPSSSSGTTTTTNNTTNNTTTTSTTNYQHTYEGDTINTTTTTTNVTINNTTGDVIDNSTTTTESAPPAEPVETCGLPGKPACKIDETGTPEDPKLDAAKKSTDTLKPLTDFVANPQSALPTLPQLNWSFALPTGCTAIALPAFAPYLQDIDICPFLPMFHDLMSVVWVLGGLFGAISIFWRNVFSQS